MRPRRAYARRWKRVICMIIGHDWGMYWHRERHNYEDICVRCGRHK